MHTLTLSAFLTQSPSPAQAFELGAALAAVATVIVFLACIQMVRRILGLLSKAFQFAIRGAVLIVLLFGVIATMIASALLHR